MYIYISSVAILSGTGEEGARRKRDENGVRVCTDTHDTHAPAVGRWYIQTHAHIHIYTYRHICVYIRYAITL